MVWVGFLRGEDVISGGINQSTPSQVRMAESSVAAEPRVALEERKGEKKSSKRTGGGGGGRKGARWRDEEKRRRQVEI